MNQQPQIVFKSLGKGCHVKTIQIAYSENIVLGDNVHIMPGCKLNGRGGGITIGDNTHIAWDTIIYSYSHNYMGEALPYDDTAIEGPVVIGRNCWLGIRVTVIPGVTIGEGAIIQAGTTVSEDVPPLAIYGMLRGHVFETRDKEHYERLVKEGAYGGANGVKLEK